MKYLITIALLGLSIYSVAQQEQQDLKVEKGRFYVDGEITNLANFVEIMNVNPEAYELAKKAKSGYSSGNVLGFIGGFMIGWPIGTAIGGGDPNWVLAGAGAGVLILAIPIISSANKKMNKAVELYEGESNQSVTSLKFKVSPNKVGFVYSF